MPWGDDETAWSRGRWALVRRGGGELADISLDGRPVLRSVRLVVRDRDWNTLPLRVDAVRAEDEGLRLEVSATEGGGLGGAITVRADGDRLEVVADLVCTAAFETNRTGLVVLHPPQLRGRTLAVGHPDGTEELTRFPADISPHQPATDIVSLSWTSDAGPMRLGLSGDTFEMEDQRNWTDASFKTYSRPLALPFPYPLSAGDRVVQSLILERTAAAPPAPARRVDVLSLHARGRLPSIGVAASTAPDALRPDALEPPPGDTVLVELDLASPAWRAALDRAQRAGLPLDVRFVVDEDAPAALARGVRALVGVAVRRVTAFRARGPARHVSDADTVTALREALDRAGLDLAASGGVRTHFTELNREHHRLPAGLEGIGFALTPLFHDLSTAQLVESVPMQRLVAEQAVRLAHGIPVDIGPIGLLPHVNAVATTAEPRPRRADLRDGYGPALLAAADPRQDAEGLAAWTVASAAALSIPGVRSLSYFEEWGPRGILRSDGDARPVSDAVRALAEISGEPALVGDSPDGRVWAFGAANRGGTVLLIANLDRTSRVVEVRSPRGTITARLEPYAWTRVDRD